MEGIANIEQGISNYEVEIAALGFASLAMTKTDDRGRTREDGGQKTEDGRQRADGSQCRGIGVQVSGTTNFRSEKEHVLIIENQAY